MMSPTLIYTILVLCAIGVISAVILFFVAQKFKVVEDPRVDEVEQALPSVNCGGCGFPGCRAFAEACVKAETLDALYCTPGGNECMAEVARILGKAVVEQEARIAVLLCNGTCENRPKTARYDGAKTCAIAASTSSGDTACFYGCLGLADCVTVCPFDAIHMDQLSGLPLVIEEKCTACGKCVTACPKYVLELRKKGPKGRRVYVSCMNKDKGAVARKACNVACIGCNKCVKECPFEAITLENNLAYIHSDKCRLCRKCAPVCPTGAIQETNFPARKPKEESATVTAVNENKDNESEKI